MISGTLATGPCTTFRDSIRLGDVTSSNPPVLIFGPKSRCGWTPASASLGWEYIADEHSWFSLVNSQSAVGGGIRLVVPRSGRADAGLVVSGVSGDVAMDPGSKFRLTGGTWHGNLNYGATIFATASLATAASRAAGVQIEYAATSSNMGSHYFTGGVVTASAGVFLPSAEKSDGGQLMSNNQNLGQARGIMFAGFSGAPGDIGIFYNSTTNQNPLFPAVSVGNAGATTTNIFAITASNSAQPLPARRLGSVQ